VAAPGLVLELGLVLEVWLVVELELVLELVLELGPVEHKPLKVITKSSVLSQ